MSILASFPGRRRRSMPFDVEFRQDLRKSTRIESKPNLISSKMRWPQEKATIRELTGWSHLATLNLEAPIIRDGRHFIVEAKSAVWWSDTFLPNQPNKSSAWCRLSPSWNTYGTRTLGNLFHRLAVRIVVSTWPAQSKRSCQSRSRVQRNSCVSVSASTRYWSIA